MRLAVAATILANTLPTLLRLNGAVEARQERTALWRSLLQTPASDRPQAAKSAIATRRRKLGAGGMLKNSVSSQASTWVECDPDVGVLACGAGEYCSNSILESSLGGVCLPVASEFQRDLQESPDRPWNNNTDALAGAAVYCDPSSPYFGKFECDCTGWATESLTGVIDCTVESSTCYEGCNDTCYSVDFLYSTDGSDLSYQYCYKFVSPFEQSFCFGNMINQTCMISVDGTSCSSCYTTFKLNCDSGTCHSERCYNFNCDNLNLGVGNTCYDQPIPPAFYECHLKVNDLYHSCSICPEDAIAYPQVYFDLPGYGSFNCSFVSGLATSGYLNPQQCTYASALAAAACCEDSEGVVYSCNVCGEEDNVITLSKAMVNFPGQPSVTCEEVEALAAQGKIDKAQCGVVQVFVDEACGCTNLDDISPTTSPVPVPTDDSISETPGASGSGFSVLIPSGVIVALSTAAIIALSVWMN